MDLRDANRPETLNPRTDLTLSVAWNCYNRLYVSTIDHVVAPHSASPILRPRGPHAGSPRGVLTVVSFAAAQTKDADQADAQKLAGPRRLPIGLAGDVIRLNRLYFLRISGLGPIWPSRAPAPRFPVSFPLPHSTKQTRLESRRVWVFISGGVPTFVRRDIFEVSFAPFPLKI